MNMPAKHIDYQTISVSVSGVLMGPKGHHMFSMESGVVFVAGRSEIANNRNSVQRKFYMLVVCQDTI